MNGSYFLKLFAYDRQVNSELLELLFGPPELQDEQAHSVFAHLLATKQIWMKRMKGLDLSDMEIWPRLSRQECVQFIERNQEDYRNFLEDKSTKDLQEEVKYKNSKGKEFATSYCDILDHVLIHGGYHRGQIAKYIREAGAEPINTDYITYVRNKKR